MELSIIIVNYNVKHFIEQCLHSVLKAIKNIDHEVFVVDNNSVSYFSSAGNFSNYSFQDVFQYTPSTAYSE